MNAVLIENPTAYNVTKPRLRVVERALEATFDLELVSTEARGHAATLAREAVEGGAKTVIVYGGDGTVNEVVNGLLGTEPSTDVTLAVLPGGGTNVLARVLGYPNELIDATAHLIAAVEQGSSQRIGVGRITTEGPAAGTRLFTFSAGLVLDADTVRRVEETGLRPRWGDLAFVYCAFRSFFSLRRSSQPPLVVDTPSGPLDAWWACFGHADPFTYLGSRPFRVTPDASLHRGIDLLAGRSKSTARTLRWALQALRSAKHIRHPQLVHLVDRDHLEVRARWPVQLQADGDPLGEVTQVRVESLPRALPVWA
jgi:diacylglycerol kinase family enzyme